MTVTQLTDFQTNHQKTLWEDSDGTHYIVSTINNGFAKETMVFYSNNIGKITSFENLHVEYDIDKSHTEVMQEFMLYHHNPKSHTEIMQEFMMYRNPKENKC